ncbi:hypothetical protein FRC17_010831, partial [Serendipita sp. 399]
MADPQSTLEFLLEYYSNLTIESDTHLYEPSKRLLSRLEQLKSHDWAHVKDTLDILGQLRSSVHTLLPSQSSTTLHRQLYTDICLTLVLTHLLRPPETQNEALWLNCIRVLDEAIVFAGAPGDRMARTQHLIKFLQQTKLFGYEPPHSDNIPLILEHVIRLPPCGSLVPRMPEPDMIAFLTRHHNRPFVIPAGVKHWPAVELWPSQAYLEALVGPGRVVPVEIGKDYRVDSWSQEMMGWEEFLQKAENLSDPIVYLAQHSLLRQFPQLHDDIAVPDLVYYSPPCDDASYSPPGNEDGVIINAWLGPRGTASPAHQDPYFNCYAQVVGRKTVWLAPPGFRQEMYPLPSHSDLSNTTSLDVFNPDLDKYPLFQSEVLKKSMAVTLRPGDLLFFPPRWWHAMR